MRITKEKQWRKEYKNLRLCQYANYTLKFTLVHLGTRLYRIRSGEIIPYASPKISDISNDSRVLFIQNTFGTSKHLDKQGFK